MTLVYVSGSLIEEVGKILIFGANAFSDLYNDGAAFQVELLALAECEVLVPVHVADEVPPLIIHHDALVKGVELEATILPTLLLALQIMGE